MKENAHILSVVPTSTLKTKFKDVHVYLFSFFPPLFLLLGCGAGVGPVGLGLGVGLRLGLGLGLGLGVRVGLIPGARVVPGFGAGVETGEG